MALSNILVCRVQICIFSQNSEKCGHSFIKDDIISMCLPFIYESLILLGLFKIVTLNLSMYILIKLTCTLKYVPFFKTQASLNQSSMNISVTIKDYSLEDMLQLYCLNYMVYFEITYSKNRFYTNYNINARNLHIVNMNYVISKKMF